MIEDYQSEYQKNKPPKTPHVDLSGFRIFILFFVAWILIASVIVIIFFGPISRTIKETNAIEIIKNRKELREEASTEKHDLCFAILTTGKPVFEVFNISVKNTGASVYHNIMEGLLKGPDSKAFSKGAVSLIAPDTKLEGIAVSGKICFVSLSSEFLASEDMENAKAQIIKTLQNENPQLTDIVIFVNGNEV